MLHTGASQSHKNNHMYGIYSDNTNGFIEQTSGKILAKQSEIDSIAFSSDKGYGTIYKNWTKNNVSEWTSSIYKSVFKADTTLNEELLVQMDGKNVVINKAHTHKECGISTTSICQHTGIASHSEAIQYDSFTKEDEFPTEGAIYLTEEIENVGSITLTKDLYICLNGFNLKGIKFIGGEEYKVVITNCQDNEVEVKGIDDDYLFENVSGSVVTEKGDIKVVSDGLFTSTSDKVDKFELYNANITPVSTPSNVSLINVTNGKTVIEIVDTEISGYDTTDKPLINTNADITVKDSTIKDNNTNAEIIKVTGDKTLTLDDVAFDNNTTGSDLINVTGDVVADGKVEITDNEVGGSIISATKDITTNDELVITDNTVTEDVLNAGNNITLNEEVEISDNSVSGSVIKADKDITINDEVTISNNTVNEDVISSTNGKITTEEKVDITNNTILGNVIEAKEDVVLNGEINVSSNDNIGEDIIVSTSGKIQTATISVADNTAVGGSVVKADKDITITGEATISNNTVNEDIISSTNGKITTEDKVDITNNDVSGNVVVAKADVEFKFETTITNNAVEGDIISTDAKFTTDDELTISDNRTNGNIITAEGNVTLNGDTNITNNSEVGKSIITTKGTLDANAELNITDNNFGTNDNVSMIEVEGAMNVNDNVTLDNNTATRASKSIVSAKGVIKVASGSTLAVTNNTTNRATNGTQAVVMPGSGIVLGGTGSLVVSDNKVDSGEVTTNKQMTAAVYIPEGKTIEVGEGKLVVVGNEATGTEADEKQNHVYGIASKNEDGFITQEPGTKFNGTENRIDSITFDNDTNTGVIYNGWNDTNVSDYTDDLYKEVFKADTNTHRNMSVKVTDDEKVVMYKIATYSVIYHKGTASDIYGNTHPIDGEQIDTVIGYMGEKFTITDKKYSSVGFTFKGWKATNKDGSTIFDSNTEYDSSDIDKYVEEVAPEGSEIYELNLYAEYEENKYTYRFRSTESDVTPKTNIDVEVTYYELANISEKMFTKQNYQLYKYEIEKMTTSTGLELTEIPRDRTLYEKHGYKEQIDYNGAIIYYNPRFRNTYTVHFDPNGGHGTMEDQEVIYNVSTISECKFEREGYTFVGWDKSSKSTADTCKYKPGAKYDEELDVIGTEFTLYAIWRENGVILTFDKGQLDGATYKGDLEWTFDKEYTIGDRYTLADANIIGYKLLSVVDKDGQDLPASEYTLDIGTIYLKTATMSNISEIDQAKFRFETIWNTTYYIEYAPNWKSDAQDKQGEMTYKDAVKLYSDESAFVEGQYTVRNNEYSCVGYEFNNFSTVSNASVGEVVEGDSISYKYAITKPGQTIKLYAIWKGIEYTLRYNKHLSEAEPAGTDVVNQTAVYGEETNFLDPYTYGSLVVKYWHVIDVENADPALKDKKYNNPGTFKNLATRSDAVITLDAVWDNTYTVKYDPNVPSQAPESAKVKVDPYTSTVRGYDTYALLENRFEIIGYNFLGWSINSGDEPGVDYKVGDTIYNYAKNRENEEVVFYAVWDELSYTIEYVDYTGAPERSEVVKYSANKNRYTSSSKWTHI